jgi:hypothetical protein
MKSILRDGILNIYSIILGKTVPTFPYPREILWQNFHPKYRQIENSDDQEPPYFVTYED